MASNEELERECARLQQQCLEQDNIGYVWQCPDCNHRLTGWTYTDLAECGTPVCTECDIDMELL